MAFKEITVPDLPEAPAPSSGPDLQAVRERYGLSQAEIGRHMDVTRSRVAMIESLFKVGYPVAQRYRAALAKAVRAREGRA